MPRILSLLTFLTFALPLSVLAQDAAQDMAARDGWAVTPSGKDYQTLLADTLAAVKSNKMGVVTQAGPTEVARKRGIDIPGNRVIGVFRNDYAVRVLALSTPAMIEAPIRLYVTENADGTATLAYKTPSHVFAPYVTDAADLAGIATELDAIFLTIAADAVR